MAVLSPTLAPSVPASMHDPARLLLHLLLLRRHARRIAQPKKKPPPLRVSARGLRRAEPPGAAPPGSLTRSGGGPLE